MRILVAPDKFKGTLSAAEACDAIERGVKRAAEQAGTTIEIDRCAMADGGEGTLEALGASVRGTIQRSRVSSLVQGESIECAWLSWNEDEKRCALIESAGAIGLHHVAVEKRNPGLVSTRGLGELLRIAAREHDRIFIGLGGSATVDGGIGVAAACGVVFLDAAGDPLRPVGESLVNLDRIGGAVSLESGHGIEIVALCDVQNPLLGATGAARMFGAQKGATAEQVQELESGLANLARVCRDAGIACDPLEDGAGAAGGLGFGLATFFSAKLVGGASFILKEVGFAERAARAELILTGEGKMDSQTAQGKVCAAVARGAMEADVPCIALVGTTEGEPERLRERLVGERIRFERIVSLTDLGAEAAIERAGETLEKATFETIRRRMDSGEAACR